MDTPETIFDDAPPADDKPADDKPTGEEEPKVEDKVEDTPAAADTETDTKTEDKKDDTPPVSKDETKVPLAALQEQREKRQIAEKALEELRAKHAEPEVQTSVFDDEEKFRDELTSKFDATLNNQRYDQSQFFVENEIGKEAVATKFEAFKILATANPALSQQMANAISPYHEMVTIVDNAGELAKMQDLPAYRATLKAELLAEIKADSEKSDTDKETLRASVPDSLAGDASTGRRTAADSFAQKTAEEVYN